MYSWSRCLIFKVLCFRTFVRQLFYSITSISFCQALFLIFFKIFFSNSLRDFFATAYLFYHIEFRLSSFIFDFFKSFFACLAFRLSQICAQFPSVGRLSVSLSACLSATASLYYHTFLSLSTTFFNFFRLFFAFVKTLQFHLTSFSHCVFMLSSFPLILNNYFYTNIYIRIFHHI